MAELAGSYEALFSRKAMKYRALGLNKQELSEEDYKKYIVQEYTFLKRPVAILDGEIYIGNSKQRLKLLLKNWVNIQNEIDHYCSYCPFFVKSALCNNYFVIKSVTPDFLGANGFVLIRATGATLLFWTIDYFLKKKYYLQI